MKIWFNDEQVTFMQQLACHVGVVVRFRPTLMRCCKAGTGRWRGSVYFWYATRGERESGTSVVVVVDVGGLGPTW